jgi:sulfotransferase
MYKCYNFLNMSDKNVKIEITKEPHAYTSAGEHKSIYFISGLPRSGSTLLCNILNQNPRFRATATSGVLDMLLIIRNNWNAIAAFKAVRNEPAKLRVIRAMLYSFYADIDKPIIFDKSRGWPGYFEMVEEILGHRAKSLICVRDIRDVLASFEKLWRKESKTNQISQERALPNNFQTVEDRCKVWLKTDQPVGNAYNRVKDALQRGYGDRMHFVFFNELTSKPRETMKSIYTFLGEEYFNHDFSNVEQSTQEDDFFHGFTDLHTIRSQVAPVSSNWKEVLGSSAEQYGNLNFWDKATIRKEKDIENK